jgi:AraC-like DNA-binding protein
MQSGGEDVRMTSVSVRAYSDPEHYESAYVGARAEILPTRGGPFSARAIRIAFSRLWLASADETAPCIKYLTQTPARAFITFPIRPVAEVTADGIALPTMGFMRHSLGHAYHERSEGPMTRAAISLPLEDMVTAGAVIGGCDLSPPRDTLRVTPPKRAMNRLVRLHTAATALADTAPEMFLNHPEVAHGLEQELVWALIECQSQAGGNEETWAQRCHETIMRRFRRVLDENPDRALYIPEICAAIGVPDRTLRLCCQEHLGMGPKQYLLLRRVHLARRSLRTADPSVSTVTDIATMFGFWHFGRFATFYRSVFGETPSATLKRQSR